MENPDGKSQARLTNAARNLAGIGLGDAHGHEAGIINLRISHVRQFAHCKLPRKPLVCNQTNDPVDAVLQTLCMAKQRKALTEKTNFLLEWRNFRDLTGTELAHAADTDKSMISLWENCKRPISEDKLRKLAKALRTTPGAILDYDPTTVPLNLLEAWSAIPEGDRDTAMSILHTFRRKVA